MSPVSPSLDVDEQLSRVLVGSVVLEEFSQLQLRAEQTPFMADKIICFNPPESWRKQEALALVEYDDGLIQMIHINMGITGTKPLNAGRYNERAGLRGFFQSAGIVFRVDYDYQANVGRAAFITATNCDTARCFLITPDGQPAFSIPIRRQSPRLTPVEEAVGIYCEE